MTKILLCVACCALGATAQDQRNMQLQREVAKRGWVVYSSRTNQGDWDLFLMRPDGSRKRDITNTPNVNEMGGRFSPDGKRILYRRIAKDAKINHDRWGSMGQLVIANADGSKPVVYGEDGDFPWASWSPDGKQVACLTKAGIEIRDLATKSVVRKMDRRGIFQQLYWSPDGKWFCGPANHMGESWTVVRMSIETGEVEPLAKYQNCTADWFPDSRRLIYSSRPANQEVADGGKLAQGVGQKPNYGWTQLWMTDTATKTRSLIYGEDGRHVYGGCMSPDAKFVLFTRSPTDGGIEAAVMHLMRLADAPSIGGESAALRKLFPKAKDSPRLTLGPGWEPHWTSREIGGAK